MISAPFPPHSALQITVSIAIFRGKKGKRKTGKSLLVVRFHQDSTIYIYDDVFSLSWGVRNQKKGGERRRKRIDKALFFIFFFRIAFPLRGMLGKGEGKRKDAWGELVCVCFVLFVFFFFFGQIVGLV